MPTRAVQLVELLVHELRTPLTVALGSLRQIGALENPVQQAALARAVRSCERLEHVATQMRDWTRLQVSEPAVGEVGLRDVVAEAVGTASATRADVQIAEAEPPDVLVRALPALLGGALSSLLVAVIRAANPGDVIALDVAAGGGIATLDAHRNHPPACDEGATFDAEWLGGVGFSLPLAHAVIALGGGDVRSAQSADGRIESISVRLAVAAPGPLR